MREVLTYLGDARHLCLEPFHNLVQAHAVHILPCTGETAGINSDSAAVHHVTIKYHPASSNELFLI
jgi:hypothetical protein